MAHEQVQHHGQYNTHYDTGHYREVKGNISLRKIQISRQMAQQTAQSDLVQKHPAQAGQDEKYSDNNQHLSHDSSPLKQ
jgi:hypothetical protein